jgi:hypothetical protein
MTGSDEDCVRSKRPGVKDWGRSSTLWPDDREVR